MPAEAEERFEKRDLAASKEYDLSRGTGRISPPCAAGTTRPNTLRKRKDILQNESPPQVPPAHIAGGKREVAKTAARPLRLVICGASGRMGSQVASMAIQDKRFAVAALVAHQNEPKFYGQPIVEFSDFAGNIRRCGAIVDFTSPPASVRFAEAAAAAKKPIVIGTTGFTPRQMSALNACAKKTAIFLSPNFSRGMNLLFYLAQRSSAALPDYDVSISEIHHAQKKDSPSGSALNLAEAVRRARPNIKSLPIVSQRIGTVVGEHTLTLGGTSELLQLTHRAQSRDVFARGALDAALWIAGRKPGLYDMRRLLNL